MPPYDLLSPRLSGQYCLSTHTRPYTFNGCLFCIQAYSALFCTPLYGLSARSTPSQYSQLHILHWFWSLILTPSSYLVPTPTVPYFTITYQYHIRHSSPTRNSYSFHTWYSNAVTTFETNPYPQQYHLQVHSATSLCWGNITI